jgi:sialic acid synthase SpsE
MGVPAFKVSSGDLTNLPFLEYLSAKGLPIILSTGMADIPEIRAAVEIVRSPLALLHCVSCYPAAPADVNLRAMDAMAREFGVPIGYSDHTLGIEVALGAVALGASILEKHLTLDRSLPGPDHRASVEPADFRHLVAGVRTIESALGDGRKVPVFAEREVASAARRSLVAAVDIVAGEILTVDHIAIKRPGTGLSPAVRSALVGRRASQPIPADTPLTMDMLA